jgi:chromosome segregation ATPase
MPFGGQMPATIEERVAYLEGKVEEHTTGLRDVKEMFIHIDTKMDDKFVQIDGKFIALEQKIAETNKRIDAINERIDMLSDSLNNRINLLSDSLNNRIDLLSDSINKRIDETNNRIDLLSDSINKRIDKLYLFILATLAGSIGSLIAAIVSIISR